MVPKIAIEAPDWKKPYITCVAKACSALENLGIPKDRLAPEWSNPPVVKVKGEGPRAKPKTVVQITKDYDYKIYEQTLETFLPNMTAAKFLKEIDG